MTSPADPLRSFLLISLPAHARLALLRWRSEDGCDRDRDRAFFLGGNRRRKEKAREAQLVPKCSSAVSERPRHAQRHSTKVSLPVMPLADTRAASCSGPVLGEDAADSASAALFTIPPKANEAA